MKKSFHVFFLFVLFAFFAVNTAWAYDVTVANVDGGSVYSDKGEATQGETVTLKIYTGSGYVLKAIEVKDDADNVFNVDISSVDPTAWPATASFTMPASNVTVTPSWAKIYTVSIMGATGGSIESETTPSGWAPTATAGETVELTITTNDHYLFTGIEVKDSDDKTVAVTLSGGKATFKMPESDVSVIGSWVRVYDVEISNVTGGTVTTDKEAVSAGEKVTLTITPTPLSRYVLAGLEVKASNGALVDVEISSDKSSATFTMPSFKVSVTPTWVEAYIVSIQGATGGTVETNKSTASVGTTVELTITTDEHYLFAGIEVKDADGKAVAVTLSDGKATFTMPESDVTVTASWVRVYDVEISNVTGGNVATDKETATVGEKVSLTITRTPSSRYVLAGLEVKTSNGALVDVEISSDKSSATFTMPENNVIVKPSWVEAYIVSILGATGGTVETNKSKASVGETVELTITTNDHYSFTGIEVKDSDDKAVAVTLSGGKATFKMPESDVSVIGSWVRVYDVEISNVTGGTVTTDKEAALEGEKVTLTITPTPLSRYVLADLEVKDQNGALVDVEISSDKSSATFTMPSYKVSVTPTWVEAYIVSIQGATGGTVETNKSKASVGETVELTITTNDHYSFTGLEVKDADGKAVAVTLSDGKATFKMPESDVSVTGSWVRVYDVEISNVTGGNVATDKETATAGEKVTLTITPDASNDYLFKSIKVVKKGTTEEVTVDVTSVTEADGGTATFTMPASDVTVTVTCEKQYGVTIANVDGGNVQTSKVKATQGTTVELTITPDASNDYLFKGVKVVKKGTTEEVVVDVTSVTEADGGTATFTMPASDVTVTVTCEKQYGVTITNVTGGTVTTDKEKTTYGETVTLTIAPTSGYQLNSLAVKDAAENAVDVTLSNNKTSATFSMPKSNVTVTSSWKAVLVDDGDGVLYVNMLETGTKELSIPENVKSFKVYDDGGKDENHSLHADGYLVLNAPEGYQLQVTGTARYSYAYFFIYDGDSEAKKLFDKEYATNGIDVGTIRSSGNKLTVYFKSRSINVGSNYSGLDLTVSLVKVDFGAVSIAKADDGKIHATINGKYNGDEALKITEAITVDNVELKREFSTNGKGFSTIVLPFAFNAAALTGVKSVIEFTGMTKNDEVGMSYIWCDQDVQESIREAAQAEGKGENYDHCYNDKTNFPGDMLAYKPYMVQMKDAQLGFMDVVGGITLEKTPDADEIKVSDGEWEFHGTIAKKDWTKEDTKAGNVWAYAAKVQDAAEYIGQFVMLGAGAYTPPLRAYMVKQPKPQLVAPRNGNSVAKFANASKSAGVETASLDHINVVIVSRSDSNEEHRTVIGTLNTRTGEFKMLRDYDLKGRKVNSVNRAKGAYYGKKVLKK